jgi:hypothetical protein
VKGKSNVKDKVETPSSVPTSSGSLKDEETKVVEQTKVEEKKETNCCGRCRWYDHSTERDFHRDGIREGLVETRAICKASKEHSKASNHLVKKESVRPCFEEGTYVAPVKEEKKTDMKEQKAEQKKETKVQPTKGKVKKRSVEVNKLNGEAKVLETKGAHNKVFVKAIA